MSEATRNKILGIASDLFAKNGFDGTSIRDIAKEADVNLASINYHFKNKQNLYMKVLDNNVDQIEKEMLKISQNSTSLKSFYWNIYLHFRENSSTFINSFKLFINNNLPVVNEEDLPKKCSSNNFNPPGFSEMLKFFDLELGRHVPLRAKEWAARVIFNQVVHTNLILGSTIGKMMEDKVDYLKDDQKQRSIEFLIEATVNYIKENPDKYQ